MLQKLKDFVCWLVRRWRAICKDCNEKLDGVGYCDLCNTFPYRKWLREEEALFVDDEDFRRKHPQKYEELERQRRKSSVYFNLKRPGLSEDVLNMVYGEDLVKEVKAAMEAGVAEKEILDWE